MAFFVPISTIFYELHSKLFIAQQFASVKTECGLLLVRYFLLNDFPYCQAAHNRAWVFHCRSAGCPLSRV